MRHFTRTALFLFAGLVVLWTAIPGAFAQTTQTFHIKAKLSPQNEVPAVEGLEANGSARVRFSLNRDTGGAITSGTAAFEAAYQFPGAVTIVGFHIHSAPVGENGPVVIDSGLTSVSSSTGSGSIVLPAVTLDTPDQIAVLNEILANPQLFYLNIHTPDNPAGAIRGQATTETLFYRATLLPENEVPAVTGLNASASVLITLDVTRDSSGNITSGAIMFDANHQFPGSVTFNGFHIHSGIAGQNGPVVISSGLTTIDSPTGVGSITKIVSLATTQEVLDILKGVVTNPQAFYVNLHTSVNPGGAVRGQLTDADQLTSIPYSIDDGIFRSNLGIQNLTNVPALLLVRVADKDGDISERSIQLPARGFVQLNRINPTVGNQETEGAIKVDPDQHVEAFVSMIENANDFPSVIPLAPIGRHLSIPAVTNLVRFKSSLVVFNEGASQANVEIISRNVSGAVTAQRSITIDAHGFFTEADVLTFLGLSSAYGPLEIRSSNNQPLSAISRVYSVTDNRGSVFAGTAF